MSLNGIDFQILIKRRIPGGAITPGVLQPTGNPVGSPAFLSETHESYQTVKVQTIDGTIGVLTGDVTGDYEVYDYRTIGYIDYTDLSVKWSVRGGMVSCSFTTFNNIVRDDLFFVYYKNTIIFYGIIVSINNVPSTDKDKYIQSVEGSNLLLSDLALPYGTNLAPTNKLPLSYVMLLLKDYLVSCGINVGMIDFDTIEQYKVAYNNNGSVYELMDNIANQLPVSYCWGISPDKIYFKKVDTSSPQSISETSNTVIKRGLKNNNSKIATRISYTGGQAKYQQLIKNGSFERYNYADALTIDSWSEVPESLASFETGWTFTNGASRKLRSTSGTIITPRTGDYAIEIDNYLERATQLFSMFKIIPGTRYTFSFWYQPAVNIDLSNPATVKCVVRWINSSGAVIVSDQFFTEPNTTNVYFNIQSIFTAPTGADKVEIMFEGSSGTWGNTKGLLIDDFTFFKTDYLLADSWKMNALSSGRIDYADLLRTKAAHGLNYIRIKSANASGTNKIQLRSTTKVDCKPGDGLRFAGRLRNVTGETFPTLHFVMEFYKDVSGVPTLIASYSSLGPAISDNKWHYTDTLVRVPAFTEYAYAYIEQTSAGAYDVDGLSIRDMRESSQFYYEDTVAVEIEAYQLDSILYGGTTTFGTDINSRYGQNRTIQVNGQSDAISDIDNVTYSTIPGALYEILAYAKANMVFDDVPDIDYAGDNILDVKRTVRITETNKSFLLADVTLQVKPMCNQTLALTYDSVSIEALAKLLLQTQKNPRRL